jgi:hypothetical protein
VKVDANVKSPVEVTQNDTNILKPALKRTGGSLFVLALVLAYRFFMPAEAIESVYSRNVFPLFRMFWDNTIARLPVPLFYLFWVLIIVVVVRSWRRWRALEPRPSVGQSAALLGLWLLRGTSSLVVFFLLFWGFNYGRLPVENIMEFEPYSPELDELRDRVYSGAERLAQLRDLARKDTLAISEEDFPEDLETPVRALLVEALDDHEIPTKGRPRARRLLPKGVLLRIGTAGVYWPWAGEGNLDAGLHPLQQPDVMAHELSHAYGFGGEGDCSFLAWLAGQRATEPLFQYAFGLAHWRRLAGRLRYADPEGYLEWRRTSMHPGIRNDLQAIYDNGDKYKDIAPAVRNATYNAYLKAQGVHEGILSYGRVVQLVEGYRKQYPNR